MTVEEFLAGPQTLADVELEVLRLAHSAMRTWSNAMGTCLRGISSSSSQAATRAAFASSSSPRPSPTCG